MKHKSKHKTEDYLVASQQEIDKLRHSLLGRVLRHQWPLVILITVELIVLAVAGAFIVSRHFSSESGGGIPPLDLSSGIKENSGGSASSGSDGSSNSAVVTGTGASQNSTNLDISQFGIRLKIPASVSDIYAEVNQDYALISTRSLASLDPACAASENTTASISYFIDPDEPDDFAGGVTMKESHPNAVKIGDKYYFLVINPEACSESQGAIAKQNQLKEALKMAALEKL